MNEQTDSELLRAYSDTGSEAAFAELVRRHVDFVYSAARRMVCDPHLADDVTQGVFVALAKSATQLQGRPVLSGWLHRTAQNIAAQTVRTIERRRSREKEAAAMNELLSGNPDATWEQIAPHLDAALGELSDSDRDALLLRYFERKSAREMAQTLGISHEAAQRRVSRAVERLREFFAKRGVSVGASGLVAVVSANSIQAAPVGLLGAITSASLIGGAADTGAALTFLKLMMASKLKLGIITAIVAALVVTPVAIQELTGEPSYGGKTVTQWLASLQLYHYEWHPDGVRTIARDANAVAADPAIQALIAIGPRAVPILMQQVSEPAELPSTLSRIERWRIMTQWKLFSKRGPRGNYPESQVARKYAAGVALLRLGTNEHAGFSCFVDAYVATPPFTSVAGGKLSGMPAGIAASSVARWAAAAFPERRAEIVTEVMALLRHTSANHRQAALEAAVHFPEEALKQKELLLRLTLDEDQHVQFSALAILNYFASQPEFKSSLSLAEFRQVAEKVLETPKTVARNQEFARNLIRHADELISRETKP